MPWGQSMAGPSTMFFRRFASVTPIALVAFLVAAAYSTAADELPLQARAVIGEFCIDCHSGSDADAGLVFSTDSIDWNDSDSAEKWEAVYQMVSRSVMPPPDSDQPTERQRNAFLKWLDNELNVNLPIGGTTLRRLSRREYENTLRSVFGLPGFELPLGFPPDNEFDGFDNQAHAMAIAPSHMESYAQTANMVADEFFPPPPIPVVPTVTDVPPEDLVISYSSACRIDGAMRLASSGENIIRNATWPTKFEAPASGKYIVQVTASAINPPDNAKATLRVAKMFDAKTNPTTCKDLSVSSGDAQTFQISVDLERGQTIVLRYHGGPFSYDDKKQYEGFLKNLFMGDPKLAAAWNAVGDPARGGSGWIRVKEAIASGDLDVEKYADPDEVAKLAKVVAKNSVKTGETLVYKYFEEGPAIAIEGLTIQGPTDVVPDRDQLRIAAQRQRLLRGYLHDPSDKSLRVFLSDLLAKLFRRPAKPFEVDAYFGLVDRHRHSGGTIDQGLHLALRTALISPAFLYRSIGDDGQSHPTLSPFELASRLSYFLKSGPPDENLRRDAASGRLQEREVLLAHAKRLIGRTFAEDFTRQWLGLSALESLMPDKRLIAKFTSEHRKAMVGEVTATFEYILQNNLSVREWAAPDFVFTDPLVGWDVYRLPQFKPPKKKQKPTFKKGIQKVAIDRDGRLGGLLCMPAVMMATANGVDTQPVLRGVWVLNNLLGSPPPEPPNSVPALTPDTSGASSPRQRLAAHMNEESCAVCHRDIDPLGFVLENFDPIGRWRDEYPVYSSENRSGAKKRKTIEIDASGTLPDGTKISDVTDLKRILVANPKPLARCVSEKLLTYATGRTLNHRERTLVSKIVDRQENENGLRFHDLLMELIDSDIFRTK